MILVTQITLIILVTTNSDNPHNSKNPENPNNYNDTNSQSAPQNPSNYRLSTKYANNHYKNSLSHNHHNSWTGVQKSYGATRTHNIEWKYVWGERFWLEAETDEIWKKVGLRKARLSACFWPRSTTTSLGQSYPNQTYRLRCVDTQPGAQPTETE
jgi:hypothetical protein